MKKLAISTALILLLSIPVHSEIIDTVNGDWYGSPYGVEMELSLFTDHTYSRTKLKSGIEEHGTWKRNGDKIIMDETDDIVMAFTYDEDKQQLISEANDLLYVFGREKNTEKDLILEIKNASENDFKGNWKAVNIKSGDVSAEPDIFNIKDIFLKINEKYVELIIDSDFRSKKLEKKNIKKEMGEGDINFKLNLVGGDECNVNCVLLEDGSMRGVFKSEKYEITIDFEKR